MSEEVEGEIVHIPSGNDDLAALAAASNRAQPSVIYNQHHIHVNTGYQGPRKGVSYLGVVSLVVAIVAILVCWIPLVGLVAVPLAYLSGFFGILGILVSIVGQRSRVGLPITGLFVAIIAASISIWTTRTIAPFLNNAFSPASRPSYTSTPDDTPTSDPSTIFDPKPSVPVVKPTAPPISTISVQEQMQRDREANDREWERVRRKQEALEKATTAIDTSAKFMAQKARVDALSAALEKERINGDAQSKLEAAGEWNRARVAYEKDRADAIALEAAQLTPAN